MFILDVFSQPKKAVKLFIIAIFFASILFCLIPLLAIYAQRFVMAPENREVSQQLEAMLQQEFLILGGLIVVYALTIYCNYLFIKKIKQAKWDSIYKVVIVLSCFFVGTVAISLPIVSDRLTALRQDIDMIKSGDLLEAERYFTDSTPSKEEPIYSTGLHYFFKHNNASTLSADGSGKLEIFEGSNSDINRLKTQVEKGEVVGVKVKYTQRLGVIVEVIEFL